MNHKYRWACTKDRNMAGKKTHPYLWFIFTENFTPSSKLCVDSLWSAECTLPCCYTKHFYQQTEDAQQVSCHHHCHHRMDIALHNFFSDVNLEQQCQYQQSNAIQPKLSSKMHTLSNVKNWTLTLTTRQYPYQLCQSAVKSFFLTARNQAKWFRHLNIVCTLYLHQVVLWPARYPPENPSGKVGLDFGPAKCNYCTWPALAECKYYINR